MFEFSAMKSEMNRAVLNNSDLMANELTDALLQLIEDGAAKRNFPVKEEDFKLFFTDRITDFYNQVNQPPRGQRPVYDFDFMADGVPVEFFKFCRARLTHLAPPVEHPVYKYDDQMQAACARAFALAFQLGAGFYLAGLPPAQE